MPNPSVLVPYNCAERATKSWAIGWNDSDGRNFGKRLAALRKASGLTQEQLAEKAEYSVEFISFIERGVHAPSLDGVERLARSLNVAEAELFRFKEVDS